MKGILLSLMAILLVSGMMGVAYASFDTVNPQNNFSDDKVDLQLMDQNEPWGDSVSATWVVTNMAPGDEFAFNESFVGLWSDFPGKVEITCTYEIVGKSNWHADDMAKYTVITSFVYNNEEWQVQDADGDGRVTFYDLKQSPLTNLPSPSKGGDEGTRFEMSAKFHQDAGNEFQGDTFNLTMIFTLKPGQAKGKAH